MRPPPLSLYIHLPWCVRKCPYCDFNSHARETGFDEEAYVHALLADLEQNLRWPAMRQRREHGAVKLESIFFGGGTPSLFSAQAIERILAACQRHFDCAGAEITLEANPGTFEQEKFAGYRAAGVNRLSIGVQSFDDAMLRALGRIHDADEARRAVDTARAAGFDNINLDLMFALPRQTLAQAVADIETACALPVTHVSHYQLTLEPNTLFHRQPPALPNEETAWDMQDACQQILREAGFAQYEVSAWARPGREARHNLNYWRFGDYLAIGAGAHGKLSDVTKKTIMRYWNLRQPRQYMQGARQGGAVSGRRVLQREELPFEFLLNVLRLRQGCEAALYAQRCMRPLSDLREACSAIDPGLLRIDETRIVSSEKGYRFLNDILENLL